MKIASLQMRWYARGGFRYVLAAILLVSLTLGATCRVTHPGEAAPSAPPATLNAGYPREAFTYVDIKDAQAALEMWTKQIVKDKEFSPWKTKVSICPDEPTIIQALHNKELDMVILNAPTYLKLKDLAPLEPVFVPSSHNHVGDEFLLLVHRDAGITRVEQLQNRKILIHPKFSALSVHILWLNSLLREQGLPLFGRFFQTAKSVENPSQAILPVFFKKMDACLVMRRLFETVAELNPQIGKDLLAIAESPPMLRGIIVFRKDYSEKLKQSVSKTLAALHTHPEGKQILTLLKYDKLEKFKPEHLRSIERYHDSIKHAQKISQRR
jgi:ABC-type phosphate/phosphonate transport system substrate-binding protein